MLSHNEILDRLRSALVGATEIKLSTKEASWDDTWAGNVEFIIGDWIVTIFNDCDSLDYIDSVRSASGELLYEFDTENDPFLFVTPDERDALERLLKATK